MAIDWTICFNQAAQAWMASGPPDGPPRIRTLADFKTYLDLVHVKYCLIRPYCELDDYPLVETRELLPSFESDLWEHKSLPGFSLVAFERSIDYFHEIFQFDLLYPIERTTRADLAEALMERNLNVVQSRLARAFQEKLQQEFAKKDVTSLEVYPTLLPVLTSMDRAQVFGLHGPASQDRTFYMAGVYASFPSDLDTEVKRYGMRIGKFTLDDEDSYEQNRLFVFQHLMELYGFPVASERRTSAALFARKLYKIGENFLVRTLGQSDRTLTTIWSGPPPRRRYPHVEKIALVSVDEDNELLPQLHDEGYLIDSRRRVVVLRVRYRQHAYSPDNVRQDRALSVVSQEIIHPLSGLTLADVGIIRDSSNMSLRLNDIVKGEYTGRIVYKRREIIENTETDEKRLKFLSAWLSKHQRRMIGYSDEFFAGIAKVLDGYLLAPERDDLFGDLRDLYNEVLDKYRYIQQARKVRVLEELQARTYKGASISYGRMLGLAVELLHELKFEIVSYFDSLVATVIAIGDSMLNNRYLLRSYVERPDDELTPAGLEIKKNYGRLVSQVDEFKSIRRSRQDSLSQRDPGRQLF